MMIVRPVPYPEEIDIGYLGRVMRRNGAASKKEIEKLMSQWAGVADKSRREVSCLELLSKVAGCELIVFVRQHSTLPLRRGITSYYPELPHGGEERRSMLGTSGMRQPRPGAYFCKKCVQEDQEFHGEAYWRREHQIAGLLYCPKHSIPLNYLEDDSAFLSSPANYWHSCQSIDEVWANETSKNEAIKRYVDISTSLLDSHSPFDVRRVVDILKPRAAEHGFQTHGGAVKSPLLSDEIIQVFGRKWLSIVLPPLADKITGKILSQMDGVLYLTTSASSTSAYILAFAALYDSTDDALNALQSNPDRIKRHRARAEDISREEILDAYIQARGNYTKVVSAVSGGKQTVIAKLRALGLPNLLGKSKQDILKAVMAFYVEKNSLQCSADKGGISVEAMEDIVRVAGPELTGALYEMNKQVGRGSGIRRAKPLNPNEASQLTGAASVKFSSDTRHPKSKEKLTQKILNPSTESEIQ